jgi:glycosyltransferase involved in cell wall biosynthesis
MVIAEACNPGWSSVPLVGYNLSRALADRSDLDVTLVTQIRNRPNLAADPITARAKVVFLDTEWLASPVHRLAELIRGGSGIGWTTGTAFGWPSYIAFEHQLYHRFAVDLRRGQYDLIHRITPLTPTYPSPLASMTRVPMLVGPLNGGLPWPKEYPDLRHREREWLVPFRRAYRLLPYFRKTYRNLAGVIAASRYTATEIPNWFHGRRYYLPENGIDPNRFPLAKGWPEPTGPFTIVCIGRLVRLKGFDLVLEAVAGSATLRGCRVVIVGDGPERTRLESYKQQEKLTGVEFSGWLEQSAVGRMLASSQLLAFPSLKEFGGGVVIEAMAAGVVPVVVDYGGPGELVGDAGVRLPLRPRQELVSSLRRKLEELIANPDECRRLGKAAVDRIGRDFTWAAKAEKVVNIYRDVLAGSR